MVTVERFTTEEAWAALPALVELLRETVNGGAAVGFMPPLDEGEAREFWNGVADGVEKGSRVLLVARNDSGIVGTVQLELAMRTNGLHRAEVQKMMVFNHARRQGIGRALLEAVDAEARAENRTLLVLDTREGDSGEQLYQKHGYTRVGVIPDYAMSADGTLHNTVIFYRLL